MFSPKRNDFAPKNRKARRCPAEGKPPKKLGFAVLRALPTQTEGRTRNTHAVWPVTDASDRLDVDMDESVEFDGLGGEGTDTVGTGRVLAAPRTPTKAEREERDVSHVP